MSEHQAASAQVRWRIVLPAIMLSATVALWYLDRRWLVNTFYWDDMPVTTARGLIWLINGPGALLLPWPLPVSLVFVAGFWACIGFLLDRKLCGFREPLVKGKWLGGALFALGLSSALLFLAGRASSCWLRVTRCFRMSRRC